MTPSIMTTTTTASQPPIPSTPTPSEVLQNLPTFESVFRFKDRVKSLEVNFSEFMRTNQSPEAVSNIPERELKKILIDKMEGNKSIQRSDEQRNLYKALVDAYEADKTILNSYGESAILKRRRKDDDDQEGPSAGSDRGSKRRREGGEHASASTPSEPATRSGGMFAVNQESALDVYSKRRIMAVFDLKIVEWHNYKHLDWISGTLKRKWRYLILAKPLVHNHVLIPNYQDFKIQDFRYSDRFECFQAIKIGRASEPELEIYAMKLGCALGKSSQSESYTLTPSAWKSALVVTVKAPGPKLILSPVSAKITTLLVLEMFVDESHEMIMDDSLDMIMDESLIVEDKLLVKLMDETLMVDDKSLEKHVDETMMVKDKSLEKLVDEIMKPDEEHFESVIPDCKLSHSC
nr:hypothetical protein [Tanacetum cinerariifolium]